VRRHTAARQQHRVPGGESASDEQA
jgi:hypothetical protein